MIKNSDNSGNPGDDALPYQEKAILRAFKEVSQ